MRFSLRRPVLTEAQRILDVVRYVRVGYAAVAMASTLVLALAAGDGADPRATAVLLLGIGLSLLSLVGRESLMSNAFLIAAMWIPYLVIVVLGIGGTTAWLPFGIFSSMVIHVSAGMVVQPLSVLLVGAAVVFQFLAITNPEPHFRMAASVVHGVPILLTYQLAVAVGVLITTRAIARYVNDLDNREQYADDLAAAESLLEKQRMDRLRATQRLHETVLNTLRAVGRNADGSADELAERCAQDLEVLDNWQFEGRPHTLQEVVNESLDAVELTGIDVRIESGRDLTLSAEIAEAIRLMLTELLINVARHARARNVLIGWTVLDDMRLVFTVEDDGIGIADKESGRIGIRRLVRETAATLDGQVLLADRPGGGTVVTLRIRLRAPGVNADVRPFTNNLPRSIIKVLGQTSLLWALIVSPIVVIDLENPAIVGAIGIVSALVSFLAVTLRESPPGSWLMFGSVLSTGNLFLAAAFSASCTSASSIQWLMNVFVISWSVTFIFGSRLTRFVSVIAALTVPVLMSTMVPTDCSEYVWLPALALLALSPFLWAIANRELAGTISTEINRDELENLLSEQLRRERQADERRLRWAAALERSRAVMTEVAYAGQVNAGLRQRAEVADAQLRGQLLIEPEEDGALAAFALQIIDEAAERDVAVKAEVLNVSNRRDPLPASVVTEIREVLQRAQGEAQLKLFAVGDEESLTLLVPIIPGSMPHLLDGTPAEGFVERQHGDLRIEFEPQDTDANGNLLLWISVTRPTRK